MMYAGYLSFDYKVPEYNVKCPNCKYIECLGYDPDDLKNTEYEKLSCYWIPLLKKKEDWNDRYRIRPIVK